MFRDPAKVLVIRQKKGKLSRKVLVKDLDVQMQMQMHRQLIPQSDFFDVSNGLSIVST